MVYCECVSGNPHYCRCEESIDAAGQGQQKKEDLSTWIAGILVMP